MMRKDGTEIIKGIISFGMILLLAFIVGAFLHGCSSNVKTFENVKYVRNYDADTIRFNLNCDEDLFCKELPIRVNGIDTPEIRGKCIDEKYLAEVGKEFVYDLMRTAERIDLENCQRGKYFRAACDVKYDGNDLAEVLLKNKLAVKYDGGTKTKDWCDE